MFLDPNFSIVGLTGDPLFTTQRYEYIESASAEDMQAKFRALIAAIMAENTARQAATPALPPFNIYDMDIAGGGDGHTFVIKLLLSTWNPAETIWIARWDAGLLQEVEASFWLASTDEALRVAAAGALAAFVNNAQASLVAVGMAGAAKGTRFMGFVAGVVEHAVR